MRISYLIVAIGFWASTAQATTVFDSGMPETINMVINDDVVIKDDGSGNGTDVTLESNANITAQAVDAVGITVEETSTLTVEGGKVTGSSAGSGAPGILVQDNTRLTIGDGTIVGGANSPGVTVSSALTVTVSGGNITAGETVGDFSGQNGLEVFDGILNVSGGMFTGGMGNATEAPGGFGLSTSASGAISGGTFIGGDGAFSGGVGLGISGGATIEITGGRFVAGAATPTREFAIFISDRSTLNLKGGLFEGDIRLEDNSILNVFGEGLKFRNSRLSGTLQSGQTISIKISTTAGDSVNLINSDGMAFPPQVPLPPALPLLAAGLGTLMLARRPMSRKTI